MKKKAVMLVLAAVAIVSLVVVGSAVKPVALVKAGEVKEKEVIEWTGQVNYAVGDPMFASVQRMCDSISTASGGRLQLTVEPRGSLCPAEKEFDGVSDNVIDFAVSSPWMWTDKFPAAGLFSMRAGGMSPMGKYLWFISGGGAELAQQMIAAYNVHLVPGGGILSPPELFLHSNTIIEVPADLEGLKIRAAPDSGEILSLMGAEHVLLPGGEIYEAMLEGWIDAFEYAGPRINWEMGFQEVADYVYISACRVPSDLAPFIVNETRWNELPDDLKAIVQEVSNEEAIRSYDEMCRLDIEALAKFRGYGCVVETLSPAIEEEFIRLAKEYYDEKVAEDPESFYAEVIQSLRDFEKALEGIRGYDKQSQEIYGHLIPVVEEEKVIEWTGKIVGGPIPGAPQRMFSSMLDASGGRLELQTIPLGEESQVVLDELNQGEIHFVVMPLSNLTNIFPAASLFDSKAGGLSPMEQYLWFISGGGAELAQQMIDAAAYNVRLIPGGGQLYTPEIFLHSNTEITETADLEGLEIRAAGDGVEIFNMMGANATFMPIKDIYEALNRGVIDAAECSSACMNWDMGLNEVATYVYLSECRVPHQFFMFLVNKTSWEELPDDLKVLVEKISREAAIAVYAETCQADIEALGNFEASENCTVEKLPAEVRQAFLEKADEYYEAKADAGPFYAEVLQSLRDFEASFREYWERP